MILKIRNYAQLEAMREQLDRIQSEEDFKLIQSKEYEITCSTTIEELMDRIVDKEIWEMLTDEEKEERENYGDNNE